MADKELTIRIKGDGAPLKAAAMVAVEELRRVDRENVAINTKREKENKRLLDQILKDQQRAHEEAIRESKRLADAQAKEAKRAADAQAKEEASKARETKRTADIAEREAKRIADTQAREAKKASDQFTREEEKKAREAKRTADIAEREAKRASDAQAKEAKKTFEANFIAFQAVQSSAIDFTAKQAELAKKRREAEEKEIRKTEEAERKKIKQVLTDEEVSLLARNKAVQASNQKRIDAAHEALTTEKKGFDLSAFAANQFGNAISSVAGQFTILNGMTMVIDAVAESFSRARRSAEEAGKFTTAYREALLEIASLKGRLGNTTAETKDQLEFRAKTLQTADQARTFQEAMLNTGVSSIGAKINQSEFDKLQVKSGSAQAALNADAPAIGSLTGLLPSMMEGNNLTADEVMKKENQIFKLIDLGGSKLSSGVNQFMKNAPLVTSGVFKDPAKMAALQSMFSLSNREGAGENVLQLTRATVGSLGRMRGQGVEVDERQAEYLKRIGATDQMDPTEIAKLISNDFSKQEAGAAKLGKKFEPITYMRSKGFANQEDIMATMNFHGAYKSGQFGKFEGLSTKAPDVNDTMNDVAKFQAVDPVAQQRKADLATDMAKVAVGAGPMEYYNNMRRIAFENMKARGDITGDFDERKNDFYAKSRIQKEAIGMLRTEGARRGVRFQGNLVPDEGYDPMMSDLDRAKRMYDVGTKVREAGGNMTPMGELPDLMRKQLKVTEDAEKRQRAGVLPAAPPGAMKRN